MAENAIFLIKGGIALDLIKQHIADKARVLAEARAMAKELGIANFLTDRLTGTFAGAVFPNANSIHPDFTKPNPSGVSFPKKKSAWGKRVAEAVGYSNPAKTIAGAFKIPLFMSHSDKKGKWSGSLCIGTAFQECGFLWLTNDGPFAMWVPDVPAIVAAFEKENKGSRVDEPTRSFKLEFDGCRRLEPEEWTILVASYDLEKKKAAKKLASQKK